MTEISRFMSDFLIAASDYERLNEAVRGFIANDDPSDIEFHINELSEFIFNAKRSVTVAVATGSDVAILDTMPDEVRDDVTYAVRMTAYWMDRIRLLENMIRTVAMEADADYIALMLHARRGLASMNGQPDIVDSEESLEESTEDGPVDEEPTTEEPLEEDSLEEPAEDAPEVFHEESSIDIIDIEDPEPIESPEQNDSDKIPEECRLRAPPEDTTPVPLTREDIQNIVLDTITQLLSQDNAEEITTERCIDLSPEPSEEISSKPRKRSTTRKTTKKASAKRVRNILKKDDEEVSE